ncbi:MAG TPA: type II secretion system protein GspL [Gammaproteobacteria bacterium]|nr:type II secretion system protein GspL [Gammaproteobacteria bacterium]
MAETLFLQMPAGDDPASWLVVDVLGNRVGRVQHGDLADAAAQAHGRRVCVLVPGAAISLLHASIPTRNLQKVLQAVPFALEDRLAEDVESLHFALGEYSGDGYTVAVLKRAHVTRWLEQLAAAGLSADQLVPDILALPVREATLSLVSTPDQIMVRLPDGTAFSSEPALTALLIERQLVALRQTAICDKAIVHVMQESDAASLTPVLEAAGLEVQLAPLNDGVLPLFAASLRTGSAINLLQGEFNRRKDMSEHWQRWRLALGLLIAFCVVGIVQQGVSYFSLRHEAAQLDSAVLQQFHKALPDVHRVVDPRAQMQQRLSQLTGGRDSNGLMPMLTALGTALQANSAVQLAGFSYHDGSLQVQVQASQIQSLDDLKNALQQAGKFDVNLDSVNSNQGQATGRLTLTGGSS